MPPPPDDDASPAAADLPSAPAADNADDADMTAAEELRFMFDDDIEMQQQQPSPSPSADEPDHAPAPAPPAADGPDSPDPDEGATEGDDRDSVEPPADADTPPADADTPPADDAMADADDQPAARADRDDEEPPEPDLFEKLTSTPSAVAGLVTDWMAHIQTNGPAAVSEVLSLVVRASRPAALPPLELVTPQMIIRNEPAASVAEIAPVLACDHAARVIVTSRDPPSRRARRAYEDFWRRIAAEATDAVLFDTDCFDTLISWLEAMACANSRALRTAACLAAYRVVDGFIDVGTRIRTALNSMQRQLQTERKKCGQGSESRSRGRRAAKPLSKKGTELAKKVDEMTANNGELVELSDKVFRSIFVLKYRDIAPDIRTISVSAVGDWIIAYPDHYLDNIHSKYIGWLLSDKDPVVRKSSLHILSRMLAKKDFYPSLEHFLGRFCTRIVDMSRDRDDAVAVAAIQLLTRLVEFDLLDANSCEAICTLAIDETQVDIRRAAGEFMARLVHTGDEEQSQTQNGKKMKKKKMSAKRLRPVRRTARAELQQIPPLDRAIDDIRELLYTIARSGDETTAAERAVDSVWDHLPALRCWEAFSSLLSQEEAPEDPVEPKRSTRRSPPQKPDATEDEEALSAEDKAILCEVLLASLRESCGKGDKARAKIVERGEFNSEETPGILASRHFTPLLPKLLSQFQADTRALTALAQLPSYLLFESEAVQQERSVEELVAKLIDVMTRHTGSPAIVKSCAETFKVFLDEQNPLRKITDIALQKGFSAAAKDLGVQVRSDIAKAEPVSVAASILRVKVMSGLIEPNPSIYSSVMKLLEYQCEHAATSKLSEDVTSDAVRTACALVMWSLSKLRARVEVAEGEDVPKLADLDDGRIQEQGIEIIKILGKVCGSNSTIRARVVSLQALLSLLTLARGIELYAASKADTESDPEAESGQDNVKRPCPDFFDVGVHADELLSSMKSCITSLLEHELLVAGHSLVRLPGNKKPRNISDLPDGTARDCFAALAQTSFQSALSGAVSHLPLLGLLLKHKRGRGEDASLSSPSAYELCRTYCQQRHVRDPERLMEELRALADASKINSSKSSPYHFVRELADALIAFREQGHLTEVTAMGILKQLSEDCLSSTREELDSKIGVLSSAGMALVTRLAKEDASSLYGKAHEVKAKLLEDSEDDIDPAIIGRYETYFNALRAICKDEDPEIPRPVAIRKKAKSNWASPGVKNRKRRQRRMSTSNSGALGSPSDVGANVRRSTRDRKRVDYARLDGVSSESDSEGDLTSQLSISDDEGDADSPTNGEGNHMSEAVEMARNLIEFNNSEAPRGSEGPLEVRNELKTGAPAKEVSPSVDGEDSDKEKEVDVPQTDANIAVSGTGVRGSSNPSAGGNGMKSLHAQNLSRHKSPNENGNSLPKTTRSPHMSKRAGNRTSSPPLPTVQDSSGAATNKKSSREDIPTTPRRSRSHADPSGTDGGSGNVPRRSPRKRNHPKENNPDTRGSELGSGMREPEKESAVNQENKENIEDIRPKRGRRQADTAVTPVIRRKRQRRW